MDRKTGIRVLWAIFGSGMFLLTMLMLGYIFSDGPRHPGETQEAIFGFSMMYAMLLGPAVGLWLAIRLPLPRTPHQDRAGSRDGS